MHQRLDIFCVIAVTGIWFSSAAAGEAPSSEAAATVSDDAPVSVTEKLNIKPIIDLRYRYEHVSNDAYAQDANAHTLRARVGIEIEPVAHFSFLIEGEGVANLNDDFNSTTNGRTAFPVVADPEALELNRAQVMFTGVPGAEVTLGRQVINLGNQRFIGAVGFRQNQQTFDAVSISAAPAAGLSLRYHYISRVHRIFGDDHPAGEFEGDTHAFEAAYRLNRAGSISAYTVLVDLGEAPNLSSATWGARAAQSFQLGADDKATLTFTGEYARQQDYSNNPADYSVGYAHAAVDLKANGWLAKAGYERLGGNGVSSFTTPLATLHKFQGFADAFLVTPATGVEDAYLVVGVTRENFAGVPSVSAKLIAHSFEAARGGADFGHEFDFQLVASLKKHISAELKAALFDGGDFGPVDRTLCWASLRLHY